MVILVMNTQFFHLLDTHSLMLTRTMMETASLSMLRWRLQREYPILPPSGYPQPDAYQDYDGDSEPEYAAMAAAAGIPYPMPYGCPDVCNLEYFKKCTCLSPATYTK